MIFLLVAGVTALATFLASALTLRFALRYKIHPPVRERDVHSVPTPRLGGVAMFLGVCVAFATAAFLPQFQNVFADPGSVIALLGATLFIVVIGIADDLLDLDWMIKLGAQFLAAGLVAWQGVQILSLPIGGITVGSSTMSMILTIFTIVLVMNAVNFIDGLDGLVAGVTLIGSGAFFVYINVLSRDMGQQNTYFSLASLITAVLIGACIGFLPYNWHRAKMFMGDAGALMVGLLMATSAIAVTGQIDPALVQGRSQILPAFIPIILPFAILLMPLLDFGLAVLRRVLNGRSPFSADRKHLHHRLLDMGHSHLGAVLIFYSWTAVVSLGCLMFLAFPWQISVGIVAVGFLICAVLTALPVSKRLFMSLRVLIRERYRPKIRRGKS